MIELVTDESWKKKCFEFIADKAHINQNNEDYSYIGILENNKIIGAIIFLIMMATIYLFM